LVFDDVGGRWLAVALAHGNCGNADNVELWEVISLQPRPDGTLTGEFTSTSQASCSSKRTVTFTRTGDAEVDSLDPPGDLPARVVSPAEALRGRYRNTLTFSSGAASQDYDSVVRTDCLRSGDRCMSYFHGSGVTPLLFANGKWTQSQEYDAECSLGGKPHVKVTADYPLPQPPQNPIAVLTGHGNNISTGSACVGGDFDEKFVRTGD
jgi:serine/threonine-protein kinase